METDPLPSVRSWRVRGLCHSFRLWPSATRYGPTGSLRLCRVQARVTGREATPTQLDREHRGERKSAPAHVLEKRVVGATASPETRGVSLEGDRADPEVRGMRGRVAACGTRSAGTPTSASMSTSRSRPSLSSTARSVRRRACPALTLEHETNPRQRWPRPRGTARLASHSPSTPRRARPPKQTRSPSVSCALAAGPGAASQTPKEVGWLHWPCGQNPGRKPEGHQRALAREAMSPGEQSSDLQGQLSV